MTGYRGRLRSNSLHQVPIRDDGIDVVIEDRESLSVVHSCQMFSRNSHAHTQSEALAQRPGRRFHPWRVAILGMTGGHALPLAEPLQFLHWQVVSCQM